MQQPSRSIGAFQWKAPELFEPECSAPTFESDVYAFGMCVMEALRGGSPWGPLPDAAIRYALVKLKRTLAQGGYQRSISTCIMPRPANVKTDQHWAFVKQLCAFEPSKRLKLNDAITILERFAEVRLLKPRSHWKLRRYFIACTYALRLSTSFHAESVAPVEFSRCSTRLAFDASVGTLREHERHPCRHQQTDPPSLSPR